MAVRIEEMVTEALPDGGAPAPAPAAASGAGAGNRAPLSLDKLDYELGRRRQRQARLWAD